MRKRIKSTRSSVTTASPCRAVNTKRTRASIARPRPCCKWIIWSGKAKTDERGGGHAARLEQMGCSCISLKGLGQDSDCEGRKSEAARFVLIRFLCHLGSPVSLGFSYGAHHRKSVPNQGTRVVETSPKGGDSPEPDWHQLLPPLTRQSGIKDPPPRYTPSASGAEHCSAGTGDRTQACVPCPPAEPELLLLVRGAARKPACASDSDE